LAPIRRGLAALSLTLFAAGCAGDRPVFLPPEPPRRPASVNASDNALERAAQREHQRLMAAFGGEYRAPAARRALEEIVARLARRVGGSGKSYEVTILNSPIVNAFALPNGRLYATRGLLALANDRAEIASVIAHEIAHVEARHAIERAELQQRSVLVQRVVSQVLGDPLAGAALEANARVGIASFSRQQELEADLIGVKAIAAAGYDPYGASRFLASLQRATGQRSMLSGERGAGRGLDILSSHPSTAERIDLVLAAARQISAPGLGTSDRDAWLQTIDGLSFGEDPSEGTIRGRRYINPAIGLTFELPEGFTAQVTRDAVLAVAGQGSRALRFDSVQLAPGQTLEAYVASGWIEGVSVGPVETATVAGAPVAITSGRGSDWAFQLAAVQISNRTYRFILAAKGAEGAIERSFRSMVESLRALAAQETASIRARRLALVAAQAGDSAATLARRMAVEDRPLEQFLILNGLDRAAALTAGQRYKVIVD
jgi:predicted Zn-dependent protease